jgi:hypothetical protein
MDDGLQALDGPGSGRTASGANRSTRMPQTVFFAGYSEVRHGFSEAALTRAHLTMTGRTFFIKLGYAWQP